MCLLHLITLCRHDLSFFVILLFTSIFLILLYLTVSSHLLHSYVDVWQLLNLIFLLVNSIILIRNSRHSEPRFLRIINHRFIQNSHCSFFVWATDKLRKMESCTRLANSVIQGVGVKFLTVLSLARRNERWRWPPSSIFRLTFPPQISLIIYERYFRQHRNSLTRWICTIDVANSAARLVCRKRDSTYYFKRSLYRRINSDYYVVNTACLT
jgi:hypothetical protein